MAATGSNPDAHSANRCCNPPPTSPAATLGHAAASGNPAGCSNSLSSCLPVQGIDGNWRKSGQEAMKCSTESTAATATVEENDLGILTRNPGSVEFTPHLFRMKDDEKDIPLTRRVIVKYIASQAREQDVIGLLSRCGELTSFFLVWDKVHNGRHKGYGFGEFADWKGGARAIRELNGHPLFGKTLKVAFARPQDPLIRDSNLHVENWPTNYSVIDLFNYFRSRGKVITCKILLDGRTGKQKNVAFVQFADYGEAFDVRSMINGVVMEGTRFPLIVSFALASDPSSFRDAAFPPSDPTASGSKNKEPMSESYSGAATGQPSIIEPPSAPDSADTNSCVRCLKRRKLPSPWPLFVGNLRPGNDETFLLKVFTQYGSVQSVKIMQKGTADKSGYGFVNMWRCEDAAIAIMAVNGHTFAGGDRLQVNFKSVNHHDD